MILFYVNADCWFLSLLFQSAINFDLIVLSESLLMSRCFSWRWLAAHSIRPPDTENLVVWMLPLLTSLKHPRLPTTVRDSRSVNSPAHHQLGKSCSVNLALVTHPDLGEGNSLTSPKPKIVWCEHANNGYLVRYWWCAESRSKDHNNLSNKKTTL